MSERQVAAPPHEDDGCAGVQRATPAVGEMGPLRGYLRNMLAPVRRQRLVGRHRKLVRHEHLVAAVCHADERPAATGGLDRLEPFGIGHVAEPVLQHEGNGSQRGNQPVERHGRFDAEVGADVIGDVTPVPETDDGDPVFAAHDPTQRSFRHSPSHTSVCPRERSRLYACAQAEGLDNRCLGKPNIRRV